MNKFCIYCGTQLPAAACFCSACGKRQALIEQSDILKMPDAPQAAPRMSAPTQEQQPPGSSFTGEPVQAPVRSPGAAPAPQPSAAPCGVWYQQAPAKPARPKCKNGKKAIPVVKNALILLTAILMVAFSFLPIFRFNNAAISENLYIDISLVDMIVLLTDSFEDLDEEELLECELAEDIQDLTMTLVEDYYDDLMDLEDVDDIDKLPDEMLDILREIAYKTVRLAMQSEETQVPLTFYFAPLLGILCVLVAIALALLSTLSLLGVLGIGKRFDRAVATLLCGFPLLFVLLIFAVFSTFGFGVDSKLSATSVLALVLSGLMIVIASVLRALSTPKAGKFTLRVVWRSLAALLSVVVLCLLFAPVLSTEVSASFRNRTSLDDLTITVNVAFFAELATDPDDHSITDVDSNTKQMLINYQFGQFSQFTYKEAERGLADSVNGALLLQFALIGDSADIAGIIALLPFFYFLVALGAALVLWQSLLYFAAGRSSKIIMIVGKVLAVLLALVSLVLVAIFVLQLTDAIKPYLRNDYTVSLGAGVIALLVLTVLGAVCPIGSDRKPEKRAKLMPSPVSYPFVPAPAQGGPAFGVSHMAPNGARYAGGTPPMGAPMYNMPNMPPMGAQSSVPPVEGPRATTAPQVNEASPVVPENNVQPAASAAEEASLPGSADNAL